MDDTEIAAALEAGHMGASDPPGRALIDGKAKQFVDHNRLRPCHCLDCEGVRASMQDA